MKIPRAPVRPSWIAGCGFAAAALFLLSLFWIGIPGAVVDPDGLARALGKSALAPPFEADGIRFLEARLLERKGEDPLAQGRLARLYLSRFQAAGRIPDLLQAQSRYESLLRADSSRAEVHSAYAACLLAAHRFPEALAHARKGLLLSGADDKDAGRLQLFDALFATGNYAEAQAQLDTASRPGVASGLESSGLATRRARLHAWKGDLAAAQSGLAFAYSEAIAASVPPPVLAWYLSEMGGLADKAGNPRAALRKYLAALDRSPGYPAALEGIARLAYAWDGNLEAADRLLETAFRNGGHVSLLLDRMRLQTELGQPEAAQALKAAYLKAATGDPISERLNYRPLAFLLSESDSSRSQALQYAERDLEARRTQEGFDCLAWVLYKRGSVAAAYRNSLSALQGSGREPNLLCHAALIAWHAGKERDAASLLDAALKQNGSRFAWKRNSPQGGKGLGESGGIEGVPVPSARVAELLAFHTHGP